MKRRLSVFVALLLALALASPMSGQARSPVIVVETTKGTFEFETYPELRTHTKGAVGIAHPGNPSLADSRIYVTLEDRPDLDREYTVFGHVVAGDEVWATLERGDQIRKMYVKE